MIHLRLAEAAAPSGLMREFWPGRVRSLLGVVTGYRLRVAVEGAE